MLSTYSKHSAMIRKPNHIEVQIVAICVKRQSVAESVVSVMLPTQNSIVVFYCLLVYHYHS